LCKQIDIAAGDKMFFPSENPKIVPISVAGASPRPTIIGAINCNLNLLRFGWIWQNSHGIPFEKVCNPSLKRIDEKRLIVI
jgi:hypothetical protein